ncbi:MAG: aldehyde ferredoxin oxidoreductase family protein [Thermodesulfobacteriota bacterium]|nr:aldehyde ferredoxin oxidoreductase family protein [Thermodesulfobacteriota bacterium]
MSYGYMDSILRIDLSAGSITKAPLDSNLKQKCLGGMGMGSKILYDEVKPGVDPLGPDNLLIFATGPLSGTMAPTSGRIDITFKSPATGMIGTSNAGGFWGADLKFAGYDLLIVRGKASRPVYIWIDDDMIEIRDAEYLWGRDTFESADLIKKELSEFHPDRIRVAAIGPAGENLVKFASLTIDYHHSASKCGIGAVMGSKNLKAVAVRGSNRVAVAQPEKFEQVVKDAIAATFGIPQVEAGGPIGVDRDGHLYSGDLPAKNFQVGMVPHWINLCTELEKKVAERKRHACYACDRPCSGMQVKAGKYAGLLAGDLHSSLYRGWGGTCYIDNLPAVYKCVDICERMGLDYHSSQVVIGFAMELYQRGIISKKETGGLDLKWGDEDAVMDLLHKIARREGFGDILAESSFKAAQKIGKGSEKYAMHIGGMSMTPHEPRIGVEPINFDRSFVLGCLTSPRGGDNVKTTHLAPRYMSPYKMRGDKWKEGMDEWGREFVKHIDIPEDIKKRMYGEPPKMDQRAYEGKASAMVFFEDLTTAYNILGLCFLRRLGPTLSAKLLSACTGEEISVDELLRIGHRIFALMWAYNGREGKTLNDLDFPERFYTEPIPEGPAKGSILSKEAVKKTMAEWYELRDWDKKTGLPTRRKLEALDLKDVADELQNLGIIETQAKQV